MSGIICMFWWYTICNTVYLVVIQRHTLFKPFNYCLMPQDMITGGGLLPYLNCTVSITVDCLFHLQTIRFHDNRKKWKHNMWVGCPLSTNLISPTIAIVCHTWATIYNLWWKSTSCISTDFVIYNLKWETKNTYVITLKSFLIPCLY